MTLMADETGLQAAFDHLRAGNFDETAQAVELMAAEGDERSKPILEALLDNRLYIRKQDLLVVIIDKTEAGYSALAAESQQDLGVIEKRDLKKITTKASIIQ